MSSALAIAAVTYVLKDLLNNGVIDHNLSGQTGSNINVSALPPPDPGTITSGDQLNLYMYRVTFNQGWKNAEFPSFDNQGSRVSNPPLALNLHYLLTAYGIDELHTEILLGYGMQFLHESPVLDRKAIRSSLADTNAESGNGLPEKYRALSLSGLADQIEQIKIIPENLSTEEISKLWTAFGSKYRPTAAYQASVVLIESNKSTKSALSVKQPNIYVNPIHQPVIEKIEFQKASGEPIAENQQILVGYNLILSGRQLKSDDVKVCVGGNEITPSKENITDAKILIQLPSDLRAGVQTVYVIHKKMMGSPLVPHRGVESNITSFILSPKIVSIVPPDPPSVDFNFNIEPAVIHSQRITLLLNELPKVQASEPSKSYSLQVEHSEPTRSLTIPIKGVKPGDYLARILVDGAESPLDCDDMGNYNSPKVSIL